MKTIKNFNNSKEKQKNLEIFMNKKKASLMLNNKFGNKEKNYVFVMIHKMNNI